MILEFFKLKRNSSEAHPNSEAIKVISFFSESQIHHYNLQMILFRWKSAFSATSKMETNLSQPITGREKGQFYESSI